MCWAPAGDIYFLNVVTGATQYDRPTAAAQADAQAPAELPAGWEAVVSQSTGDTYYRNLVSGEAVWDFPTAAPNP